MFLATESSYNRVKNYSQPVIRLVGENIMYLRGLRGYTRNSFILALRAVGVELSLQGLVNVEWDKNRFSGHFYVIAAIAEFFNVPIHRLMFEDLRLAPDFQDRKPKVKKVYKKRVKKVK